MKNQFSSERLKALRKENNLTQAELGNLAGCRDCFIMQCEKGQKQPSVDLLARMASALNCTTDYLMCRD